MERKAVSLIMLTMFLASVLTMAFNARALPTITAFFDDLTGFNAAAGSPPVVVDFDDIAPSTDITGLTIHGAKFDLGNDPVSAPLIVVRAIDTYTPPGFDWSGPNNKLYATSGENVLSPGGIQLAPGPNPLLENDDLALTLSTPVSAIGLDLLYQSLDGASYTGIALYDAVGNMLYSNGFIPIPGGGYAPGGTTFVGFVSDSSNIKKIVINEFDDNNINPDSNIGFDTIRLSVVPATIDIGSDTLNLKSKGQWITAYIQLPEGCSAADIDASTILLNGTIAPVLDPKYGFVTNPSEYLVDHNNDGILERMVKFDRATVESFIYNQGIIYGNVSLTITGKLFDGTPFEGTDVIFVNYAGDANNDGTIDILDAGVVSAHWYPGPPTGPLGYDSNADFNSDGTVDISDVAILSVNWGQTVPLTNP